jgi:hypothetical protein
MVLGALHPGSSWAMTQDGQGLQRMCQGADKVKALSMMCFSYLNGYLDTAAMYEKGKPPYCVADADKEHMPNEVVKWLRDHPETTKEPAPALLKKILSERYSCHRAK